VSEYRSRYADEIAYMDHSVGELLAAVERYSPTVIAFTGDHGESFGERGFYFAHGHSAAPDLSHVPFILGAPRLRPERRADPVSHVDLMPTLLELAGLPPPANVEGVALGPLLRTGAAIPPRAVFCDIGYEVGTYGAHEFQLSATPDEKTWALQAFYQQGEAAQAGARRRPRPADRLRDLSMGRRPDLDRARPRARSWPRASRPILARDTVVGDALPAQPGRSRTAAVARLRALRRLCGMSLGASRRQPGHRFGKQRPRDFSICPCP
jgi:hypothetical protein